MAVDTTQVICDAMQNPQEAMQDGFRFKKYDLDDLLAAARFLGSKDALTKTTARQRLHLARFVPPGAI